jgi:hypothetical protein
MSKLRNRRRPKLAAIALLGLAAAMTAALAPDAGMASSKGPFGGFTGAPGEETCRHCHDSFPLNVPGGLLAVTGFPEAYVPGQTYAVTVTLTSDSGVAWGFEATVLSEKKKRVGKLSVIDRETTKIVPGVFLTTREYVVQKKAGSYDGQRGSASWTFNWRAPRKDKGPLTMYVAGNVANDNEKKTGDFIYATQVTSQPAG